jgi:O-antigen/teichoic acid export membrane protein
MATAVALISLFSVYLTYHRHALVSSGAGPDGAIYQFVLIATVLVALVLPHSHPGLLAVEAVAAMGVAAAACLVIELIWCSLTARSLIGSVLPEFRLREWLGESLPIGGSAALATLVYSADVIAVRLLAGSDKAALYAVASSLASFVWIPRTAVGSYFSQEAPHLPEAGRAASLQQLIGQGLTFSLGAAAVLGLVIALFNQTLLGLYGQSYLAAWPVLFLLLAARAIEAPAMIGGRLLILEGYGRTIAVLTVWMAAVFIGLLALLVTLLGEVGAALAVLLFGILSNAMFYRHTLIGPGLRLLPQWRLSAA